MPALPALGGVGPATPISPAMAGEMITEFTLDIVKKPRIACITKAELNTKLATNRWAALADECVSDDDATPEVTGTKSTDFFNIASDDELGFVDGQFYDGGDAAVQLSLDDQDTIIREFLQRLDNGGKLASIGCQTEVSFLPQLQVLA